MKIESIKSLWWIWLKTGGNLAGYNKNVYFALYMVYIAFLYHSHYTTIIINLWITKIFLLMFKVILFLIEKRGKEKYRLYIFSHGHCSFGHQLLLIILNAKAMFSFAWKK